MLHRALVCFFAFAIAMVQPLFAQIVPEPALKQASHTWVTRGSTFELTLTGDNLDKLQRVIVDGAPGLNAQLTLDKPSPKSAKVKITIDANAPLGERELRVVSAGGVSNKIDLNVTFLPVIAEKEPNSVVPAQGNWSDAQIITLPATIHGLINGGADTDAFRFTAKKSERLVFEVFAQRGGSGLDSSLKLYDAAGREVARSEDTIGTDSLIAYEVPADGEMTLLIHDVQYRGGGNYTYRINAGTIPYVHAITPMGGKRGTMVDVKLHGWNLPSDTLRIDLTNKPAGLTTILATPDGAGNPLPFVVSEAAEFLEVESNNTPATANFSEAPLVDSVQGVIFNGSISQQGDIDFFHIKVTKPAKFRIAVDGMRLGSVLDALLTLHDMKGNVIARSDDAAPGTDAALVRDLPAGDYLVSITDLTSLGGSDYGYRLSVAPPQPAQPGFTVRFFPDTIRLHRGGRTLVQCEVFRTGGFGGPVTVALKDPPAGVTATPLVIENAPVSGLFIIEAAKDADLTTSTLNIIATGAQGEQKLEHIAQPLVSIEPVKAAYLTVLDAVPFTINQPKPLTDEEIEQTIAMIATLEAQLLAPHAELDAAAAAWEQKTLATVQGDIAISPWQHIGPFAGASMEEAFTKAFDPEKEIDLKKTYGTLKWEAKPQWVDGTVWNEFIGDNAANYLHRTIEVAADRDLDISLGSDDGIKVFHNGKEVLANNIGRGAAADQEKVTLKLKAGANTLLLKIVNGSGPSGFYFKANAQTHGIPAPIVDVLKTLADKRTAEQKAQLQTYYRSQAAQLEPVREQIAAHRKRIGTREELTQIRKKLKTLTPELAAAQAQWEATVMNDVWTALEFTEMKSKGGARFNKKPDDSVLLAAANQPSDTYTLVAPLDLKNITAIRLEALADKALPAGGPGRAQNGNFVLTQFVVNASPRSDVSQQAKVNLHSPTATFAQDSWPIVNTLDGNDGTGWAVSPRFNENHTALFLVKDFAGHEGGSQLTITMRCESPHVQHNLGKFRISVTTTAKPDLNQPSLPAGIAKILGVPADKRNAKQKAALAEYYLSVAPQLDADRARLAVLEAAGASGTPTMIYNQTSTIAFEINRAKGFTGDITVTALGYADGRDAKGNPNVITKDLEAAPVVLKGDQTIATFTLKAKDKSDMGTRDIVLVATATIDGQQVTQVTQPIAVSITK